MISVQNEPRMRNHLLKPPDPGRGIPVNIDLFHFTQIIPLCQYRKNVLPERVH